MKKIYAVSHNKFIREIQRLGITNDNVKEHNTAFIQIGNTDLEECEFMPFTLNNNDNVLSLRFDDCDEVFNTPIIGSLRYVPQYPMSEEQAEIIFNFIENNKDKATFLVHCKAGQSRSGGVIKFISEYFEIPYNLILRDNPMIYPNHRIVSLLRQIKERKDGERTL